MSADITVMDLLSLILASITKREWRSTRVTMPYAVAEYGSFCNISWSFADGYRIRN